MIDIGYYIEIAIEWLTEAGAGFFDALSMGVEGFIDGFQLALYTIPFYIFILLIALLAWWRSGKGIGVFTLLGLLLIYGIEAARSFSATPRQLLFKVQLPLALTTILIGINQTIMMALSMVVVSAMISAGGLGSARIGLVVPAYELDYELLISSGPAMTTLLDKAIKKNEWIVVTGWTPHWMFDRYDLKVLADPKNTYGASESIHAIARKGFGQEHPFVAELLGNIHLTDAQISSLMGAIEQKRGTEREAVRKWIKQNQALVNSWIPKNKEAKMYKYDYRRLRV